MKNFTFIITVMVFSLFLASCAPPSPLYGTWADNRGNTISFLSDDKFIARISSTNYEGMVTVLLNVLTLDMPAIPLRIVTEWDIRGNILYLDWSPPGSQTVRLSLYKTSN